MLHSYRVLELELNSWPQHFHFLLDHSIHASGWKWIVQQESMCVSMWLGAYWEKRGGHLPGVAPLHKSIISWQGLSMFIAVNTWNVQSTKETGHSGDSCNDLKFEDPGLCLLIVCLLCVRHGCYEIQWWSDRIDLKMQWMHSHKPW